jgi:hypothetical protein
MLAGVTEGADAPDAGGPDHAPVLPVGASAIDSKGEEVA